MFRKTSSLLLFSIIVLWTSLSQGETDSSESGSAFLQEIIQLASSTSDNGIYEPPLASGVGNNGLTFNFIATGNLLSMQSSSAAEQALAAQVIQGYQTAANRWSSLLTDSVTININLDYGAIGSGSLGGASSSRGTIAYDTFRASLYNDATSAYDGTASANLPTGSAFSTYINRTSDNPNGSGSATPYVDNNGDANNSTIRMTTANAKSLGLLDADNAAVDASITFTDFSDFENPYPTDLAWDFDTDDGIGATEIDFIGTATHEIGHVLGFISGVDILDRNSPNDSGTYFDASAFTYVAPLDMFRVSEDSEAADADIDWTADTRDKYFSIDGGETFLATFSEGAEHGDGSQASHWEDYLGIGIMDPTISSMEVVSISSADLLALDVIGWDIVPEPSSILMIAVTSTIAFWVRRRYSYMA